MTDARIARIERGIEPVPGWKMGPMGQAALADLRAWQEIAERHRTHPSLNRCKGCGNHNPCKDRQAADAALDRLNALWGTDD